MQCPYLVLPFLYTLPWRLVAEELGFSVKDIQMNSDVEVV